MSIQSWFYTQLQSESTACECPRDRTFSWMNVFVFFFLLYVRCLRFSNNQQLFFGPKNFCWDVSFVAISREGFGLVMCSLEHTHDSEPTPTIVSPSQSRPESSGAFRSRSESLEVVRSRSESFGVVRSRSESSGDIRSRSRPEADSGRLRTTPTPNDSERLRTTPDNSEPLRTAPDESGRFRAIPNDSGWCRADLPSGVDFKFIGVGSELIPDLCKLYLSLVWINSIRKRWNQWEEVWKFRMSKTKSGGKMKGNGRNRK